MEFNSLPEDFEGEQKRQIEFDSPEAKLSYDAKGLIEKAELKAVIAMPSGVFKPYAGVSTAILIFTNYKLSVIDYIFNNFKVMLGMNLKKFNGLL